MINIICCIDASFWKPLGVTLCSLLLVNPEERFHIFVVSEEPPPEVELLKLGSVTGAMGGVQIDLVLAKNSDLYRHLPVNGHLSSATYLRLFMTEFLPPTLDRVIYLDSDLLICSKLSELWNFPLGDAYLGAAREPFDARQRTPLGFARQDFYFNAGVMLVNLRKWREDDVIPKFLEFAQRRQEHLYSPDQDILNSVFRGRVRDIGLQWNWQALFVRMRADDLGISPEEWKSWKHAPKIIHFTSAYKPWFWRWAPHYQKEYTRLVSRTPWKDTPYSDKNWGTLATKFRRCLQRSLEWNFPGVARGLRDRGVLRSSIAETKRQDAGQQIIILAAKAADQSPGT